MNAEKSREYFSMYFEGTLERGLREQFERTLESDAQVQAEYKAFARTMNELEALKNPVPEPSFDLHERISQRLDKHIYELERQPKRGFFLNWKKTAVAGIAGLALIGATTSLWMKGNSGMAGTGPVPPRVRAAVDMTRVNLIPQDGKWLFSYSADRSQEVEIRAEGEDAKSVSLAPNDTLESPLENDGQSSVIAEVRVSGVRNPIFVAIPGSMRSIEPVSGSGDLKAYALAIADLLGKPVMVVANDVTGDLSWTNLESNLPISQFAEALKPMGYTIEERENGTIWLLP